MKKFSILLLVVVAFALPAFCQQDTVVEEIVARINNSIVTRADLQRSRTQMLTELKQQDANAPSTVVEERQKNLLRDLVDQQLLVQKGQDLGISADTDLIKKLDDLRKELGANSMEDLEKLAEQQGVSFEDFKQNMRNGIITQQVIGREVGSKIQITHQEVQAFYDAHKAELEQPERVRLSEILIPATPPAPETADGKPGAVIEPTPEQLAAADATAQDALKQIKGGMKFEEAAKKFSKGTTADQGGDLGYFKRGMLSKDLEDKTFAMKQGEITDVVRTKQGYVILAVTEHTAAGIPPLAKIEDQIQNQIYMEKLQPALRDYLTKLREEAYIDIKSGFVDTGASPNQTKPVVLTAANSSKDASTKTKKKKRFLLF